MNLLMAANREKSPHPVLSVGQRMTRFGQKVTVTLNVRPQWKQLRYFGRWMRKQDK